MRSTSQPLESWCSPGPFGLVTGRAILAADLLAWLRLLILDHHPELRKATPARLREQLLKVPARLVKRARGRIIRLPDDHPHVADLILAWTKIHALATSPP